LIFRSIAIEISILKSLALALLAKITFIPMPKIAAHARKLIIATISAVSYD